MTALDDSPAPVTQATRAHDFDLHGIVGIRLLDATERDVAKVQRQLGPLDATLDREPDITIRFVDRATTQPLVFAGLEQGGFNDEGFFVLQGKNGVNAKARIPFGDIGDNPVITCERAMPAIPHLLSIINLTALGKGVLPLHSSAFTLDSTGVLVTGWAKGGKTESLLACMAEGATYVGDEWVYLTPTGEMFGLPEPIRLWAWHLQQLPALLRARPRGDRTRLAVWERAAALAAAAARTALPGSGVLRKGAPVIGRQAYLQIPPVELFGADRVALRGNLNAVVLVLSHDSAEVVTESAEGSEISARMAASLSDERAAFLNVYRQFRYAFPAIRSRAVETAEEVEATLLADVLDRVPAAKVLHPYRCDIEALGRAVLSAARNAMGSSGHSEHGTHPGGGLAQ